MKKLLLIITAMLGFTCITALLHAQHLFSVSQNNLSMENVTLLKNQATKLEISTLSLTKNNENTNVYPVALSSAQNTKIVILNEETGNHVVITPAETSLTEFQLAPFFIEELRQGVLGNAPRFLVMETTSDFLVKNVAAVSATRDEIYVPQYFYGSKENVREALPKNRQIINIFREKPQLISLSDTPEQERYLEQLEEEMSYYVYMYKLPDGTLTIHDEHFNPDNDRNVSSIGGYLEFALSGTMNTDQRAATEYALELWSEQLAGTVPVDINVRFISMGS